MVYAFYTSKMAYVGSDSSSEPTSQPAKSKAQALEDILHEFGPIEQVL